jgi:AraC family transcriptional regulator of adaptative response/methylated-DNA-[protein]-cysteine methyltransferase
MAPGAGFRLSFAWMNSRWAAVQRRDASRDGSFVYAVRSTGIYCRPSCPSRRPGLRQVRFFRSPPEAEREGFRACRRCGGRPDAGVLRRACAFIADHPEAGPTLAEIARPLGLSAGHLQRLFRRALGVTPAEYARVLRFERFRAGAAGGRRLTDAMLRAGFGSSSRLYERARANLGMTPRTVFRKGEGMVIVYDLVRSPMGPALIAATPDGICAVDLGDSARGLLRNLKARYSAATLRRDPSLLRAARERLRRLIEGGAEEALLPLDVRATAFQARVWTQLRAIPRGSTRSYGEIARRLGRPTAARAVARACASNRLAVLVPCHRAVGAGGRLTGYRWGLERKKALLDLERG